MSGRGPLLDAIRRARGSVSAARQCGNAYADIHRDDLALLLDAAVQSLADADDVRSLGVGRRFLRDTDVATPTGTAGAGAGYRSDPAPALAVRLVVDDDGTVVEVTALLPEAPR